MKNTAHQTVLLQEAVDALLKQEQVSEQSARQVKGVYIDATFGRGGHSARILETLGPQASLIAFDQDPEAVEVGRRWEDPRFEMVYSSFAALENEVRLRGLWGRVNGILFDLGVSSPQLDQAERGFSFMQDGPLDMRMDTHEGVSAAQWLATVAEPELVRVLREYGEERYAKRIAKAIIDARALTALETTSQLAKIVAHAIPRKEPHKHPATRTFQAIRIAVNRELDALQQALAASLEVLAPEGRVVVISFHSLEDRRVKRFFQQQQKGDQFPRDMPVTDAQLNRRMRIIGKAVKPNKQEVNENVRARSAVMRVAEKLV